MLGEKAVDDVIDQCIEAAKSVGIAAETDSDTCLVYYVIYIIDLFFSFFIVYL